MLRLPLPLWNETYRHLKKYTEIAVKDMLEVQNLISKGVWLECHHGHPDEYLSHLSGHDSHLKTHLRIQLNPNEAGKSTCVFLSQFFINPSDPESTYGISSYMDSVYYYKVS